jgi:hypothetical protein
MKAEYIASLVAVTVSITVIVTGLTYYNIKRDESMKSNIESAIVKGIDPVAVKCAYGKADSVCIVYAANKK